MSEVERPTCRTCPYWKGLPLEEGDAVREGVCMRFPPIHTGPRVADGPGSDCADADSDKWSQPWICEDRWCGEHPDFPAYLAATRKPEPIGGLTTYGEAMDRMAADFYRHFPELRPASPGPDQSP